MPFMVPVAILILNQLAFPAGEERNASITLEMFCTMQRGRMEVSAETLPEWRTQLIAIPSRSIPEASTVHVAAYQPATPSVLLSADTSWPNVVVGECSLLDRQWHLASRPLHLALEWHRLVSAFQMSIRQRCHPSPSVLLLHFVQRSRSEIIVRHNAPFDICRTVSSRPERHRHASTSKIVFVNVDLNGGQKLIKFAHVI